MKINYFLTCIFVILKINGSNDLNKEILQNSQSKSINALSDTENGKDIKCVKKLNAEDIISHLTYSPCGNFLIAGTRGDIIQIWDLKNDSCCQTISIDSSTYVMGIACSNNGQFMCILNDYGMIYQYENSNFELLKFRT